MDLAECIECLVQQYKELEDFEKEPEEPKLDVVFNVKEIVKEIKDAQDII